MTDTTPNINDEIAGLRAEIVRIHATDRGCGLDEDNEIRLDRVMNKLQALEDHKAGRVRVKLQPVRKPLKPHRKAKRKTAADMVPNPCYCGLHDWSTTGRMPKKHTRALTAYDLCTRGPCATDSAMCQVYQLFRLALSTGKHPAEFVEWRHWFKPTQDDRDHLDWVCLLNAWDWMKEAERVKYGKDEIIETTFAEFLTTYGSRA